MPKRASNEKNGASREAWMKKKVQGRTKQIFTVGPDGKGKWVRVEIPEDKE